MAAVAAVVLLVVGLVTGLGWWLGLFGAAAGAALAWWLVQRTPARALAAVQAADLDAPRLANLVEGLCLTNGIGVPRLMVIETSARNTFTVGLSEETTALVVTRGLLDGLSRMELEGVVARQLGLIKDGFTARATVVAAIGSVADGVIGRLVEPRCDVVADINAVGITRYPPGLLGALESIEADNAVASAPSWTRHLWIEDPLSPAGGRPTSIHSPIDERLATLREL